MRLYDSEAAHLSFPVHPIMLLCSETCHGIRSIVKCTQKCNSCARISKKMLRSKWPQTLSHLSSSVLKGTLLKTGDNINGGKGSNFIYLQKKLIREG